MSGGAGAGASGGTTGGSSTGGSGGAGGAGGSNGGSTGGSVSSGGSGDQGGEAGEGATGSGGSGDTGAGGDLSTGGSGGSAGIGGASGGSAGLPGTGGSTGGSGGSGNQSGTGGVGGMGGGAGSPPATGCAVLTTALDAAGDQAHFVITLAGDTDLSSATIGANLHVNGALGGTLLLYVQQATYEFGAQPGLALASFSGFTTVSWDLGADAPSGVDLTRIRRIGLEISADGASSWSNPTIVSLDSITVAAPSLSFPFDDSSSVYVTPTTFHASDRAIWLNSATADTTALTGSSVEWSASCP
jgi:hypothetical protein